MKKNKEAWFVGILSSLFVIGYGVWLLIFSPHFVWDVSNVGMCLLHVFIDIILPVLICIIAAALIAMFFEDEYESKIGVIFALIIIAILIVSIVLWSTNFYCSTKKTIAISYKTTLDSQSASNVINQWDKYVGATFLSGGAGAGGIASVQIDVPLEVFAQQKLDKIFVCFSTSTNPNSEMDDRTDERDSQKNLYISYYGMESSVSTRLFHSQSMIYTAPKSWLIQSAKLDLNDKSKVEVTLKSSSHGKIMTINGGSK